MQSLGEVIRFNRSAYLCSGEACLCMPGPGSSSKVDLRDLVIDIECPLYLGRETSVIECVSHIFHCLTFNISA